MTALQPLIGIKQVFDAMRALKTQDGPPKRPIGFVTPEDKGKKAPGKQQDLASKHEMTPKHEVVERVGNWQDVAPSASLPSASPHDWTPTNMRPRTFSPDMEGAIDDVDLPTVGERNLRNQVMLEVNARDNGGLLARFQPENYPTRVWIRGWPIVEIQIPIGNHGHHRRSCIGD